MKSNIVTNQQKIKVVESIFGEGSIANSGKNISVICPACRSQSKNSTKKKKLAISLERGIYHCWVCETKGRNIAFIAKKFNLGNKNLIQEVYDVFQIKKEEKEEEKIILSLPDDFKLLVNETGIYANSAKEYLKSRGLAYSDLYKYKIGISYEYEYSNRVIFPSHDEDLNLNFYLSRSIDENAFRKYKNCDAKRKEIIYNEHQIDWNKPVVLVEGIFDAIKAGDNAIPILGSWLDEEYYLFEKIVKNNTPVILGFDPDAKEKERKLAEKLYEYNIEVYVLDSYTKDFGDMSRKEIKTLIENAKLYEHSDRMTYLIQSIRSGSLF